VVKTLWYHVTQMNLKERFAFCDWLKSNSKVMIMYEAKVEVLSSFKKSV